MGYWRDHEKTQHSFIRHPRTGERLYRTGDLGRYLPDGNLEFLGRSDFQVKIHGFRVELGEIEATLLSCADVASAAVTAIGTPQGGKRLVAYVTAQSSGVDADSFAKAIRDQVADKLPAYMVPAAVIVLETLPLTGNGKVDRTALPMHGPWKDVGR